MLKQSWTKRSRLSSSSGGVVFGPSRLVRLQTTVLAKAKLAQEPLYTPQDPLTIPSQSHVIDAKIQRLKQKLQEQEQERAGVDENKLSIWDVITPFFNLILVGSTMYIGLQYCWLLLEREELIEAHGVEVRALESEIQALLDARKSGAVEAEKRWFFWR
ncbi:unnamed protein product [Kuraishia capsulata CBS 1993]|uniref:Inner membrane assembly complex subunit 17 n=1 Tax=Kuraishia capsulata CBS 1993 TaxID=1382522 RepID=W6MY18_9ASCO|nr:uncharacterized protein KUCA_T00005854001 [Kuraishia capsulata CBS 1993]CDK29860.1 unnamed protein product [Kuraishia capsulata CBS 1993]